MKHFVGLPYGLKRVVLSTALMAPRVNRRLTNDGYESTVRWLNERSRPVIDNIEQAARVATTAELTTARIPGRYNCLCRSLVVWWLLGGNESALIRFGVSPDGPAAFKFHAWVEKDEVVINDAADIAEQYAPFATPPQSLAGFD